MLLSKFPYFLFRLSAGGSLLKASGLKATGQMKRVATTAGAVVGFAFLPLTLPAHSIAQQASPPQTSAHRTSGTTIDDGVVKVEAVFPEEIRVGEQFQYQLVISNTSDSLTIHNLKLKQTKTDGLTIENVSMEGQSEEGQSGSGEDQGMTSDDGQTFTVSKLDPSESRRLTVTAGADQEGDLMSCLEIASYTPAMCLMARVVKPELEIVKAAPEQANLCEIITVKYSIKNGGTGNIEQFTVVDELADGLITVEGAKKLEFTVEGLEAGQVRAFEGRLLATRAGDFSSRAIARAENLDLQARSANKTIQVVAADLDAEVEGQSSVYAQQPATFNAKVTNVGNVAAEDVRVVVKWSSNSQLVDISEPTMEQASGNDPQSMSSQGQSGQPTPAVLPSVTDDANNVDSLSRQDDDGQRDQDVAFDEQVLTISRLEPNQTASFRYVIRPRGAERVHTQVVAAHACALAFDNLPKEAAQTTVVEASAQTDIIRLAALRIMAIDNVDPIEQGQDVTYTVVVTNQGDAADKNVTVTAELPDGLEFASANGPSEHRHEGSQVSFEPVEALEPGDDVRYTITAKANGDGDVIFKANLNSDSLEKETTSEEPTRLFSGQASR